MYEYFENLIYMLELDNLIDCDDEENNFGRDYDNYYDDEDYDDEDYDDEFDYESYYDEAYE